jgi:hypothetical protein
MHLLYINVWCYLDTNEAYVIVYICTHWRCPFMGQNAYEKVLNTSE